MRVRLCVSVCVCSLRHAPPSHRKLLSRTQDVCAREAEAARERDAAQAALAKANAANDTLRRQIRENKETKELQVQLQVRCLDAGVI